MENAEITTKKTFSPADLFNKWWHLIGTILTIISFLVMAHVQLDNNTEDIKTLKEENKSTKDRLNTSDKNNELLRQELNFVREIDNRILHELEELRKQR
jgi:hypothetical protein